MLLVEVRRLDIAPNTDQFWTIVSRINGTDFMGVLYRAREAIFDSAGISFTIDLLSKFLQFDVTKSWSSADEGKMRSRRLESFSPTMYCEQRPSWRKQPLGSPSFAPRGPAR